MLKLADHGDRERIGRLVNAIARERSRPPAVVVGSSINALGVVRSLGRAGIPVVWLASEPHSFVHSSRFAALNVSCDDLYYDDLVPTLLRVGALADTRSVLFLTHDFQVKRVSDARDALGAYYRFALPPREMIDKLLGKAAFYRLAKELDLAIADTQIVSDGAGLREFLATVCRGGSWVVKPLQKSDAFEQYFGKAVRIRAHDEWTAFADLYQSVNEPLMIQPWLAGPDSSVFFCLVVYDEDGQLLSSFSGRKIRQFKPEVGNTASAERYFEKAVHERTRRFFGKCDFVGMGSLEFKRQEPTGEFLAIEPTVGRTDLQSEMTTINGCNLTAMYYFAVTGQRRELDRHRDEAARSTKNRVWRRGGADWRSASYYRRQGQLTTREWIWSLLRPTSFSVWRSRDPGPFVSLVAQKLQGRLVRGLKAGLQRVGISKPVSATTQTRK